MKYSGSACLLVASAVMAGAYAAPVAITPDKPDSVQVMGESESLSDLLSNATACAVVSLLQTSLAHPPVYQLADNGCEEVADGSLDDADSSNATLFSDEQCLSAFDFQPTEQLDYCTYVRDPLSLGNAEYKPETLNRWTLSPGTRFDIGAVPLSGLTQPFTQRVNYKQVTTAQGECSLEMRIHTLDPDAADRSLKPLIAFHGGSWQRRSSGALGIESVATVFANQGYVVFAPFYRLIDTDEGNAACNDASLDDVLEDASDALDWVNAQAARYGAEGKPALFGQSAGGHMSAVLAVERPDEIASAVLFYAPTDFTDFARQIINGEIDGQTGQRILETVVGQTLDTLDLNSPIIRRNTLTERVANRATSTPPFFLLHGMRDTVLPFNQSVRFCDALASEPGSGAATNALGTVSDDPFKRVIRCDLAGSELHLITEGEHALDLCIAEDLCLAGTPFSARATTESVQRMLEWLSLMDLGDNDDTVVDVPVADQVDSPVADPVSSDPVSSDPVSSDPVSSGQEGGAEGASSSTESGSIGLWVFLMMLVLLVSRGLRPGSVLRFLKLYN